MNYKNIVKNCNIYPVTSIFDAYKSDLLLSQNLCRKEDWFVGWVNNTQDFPEPRMRSVLMKKCFNDCTDNVM